MSMPVPHARSWRVPDAIEPLCAMNKPEFKDHFSKQAHSYSAFRPTYPDELFDWIAEQCVEKKLAWDVATGNGQAAIPLARRFSLVIATDASAQQLAAATVHDRVSYRVATAEESGLGAASCNLIAVAQALHWFHWDAFWSEVQRVAQPDCVLVAWSYGLHQISPHVDAVVRHLYTEIVGPYWPPERQHVENGYAAISFPFARIHSPEFEIFQSQRESAILVFHDLLARAVRFVE
jgi:ubiquinone/menaquinone biosynthesis C-methylase UbiE